MSSKRPVAASRKSSASSETPLACIQRLTAAWIRKDAAGMSEELADDITEIGPVLDGPLSGKAQFFRYYRRYFETSLQIEKYRILRPRVIRLTARQVLVHFGYEMRTLENGRSKRSRGQESMLLEKRGRRWKVKFIHWHGKPE